ncbi:hypothetical protein GCM10028816_47850 [Spirosoma lituiforme]
MGGFTSGLLAPDVDPDDWPWAIKDAKLRPMVAAAVWPRNSLRVMAFVGLFDMTNLPPAQRRRINKR